MGIIKIKHHIGRLYIINGGVVEYVSNKDKNIKYVVKKSDYSNNIMVLEHNKDRVQCILLCSSMQTILKRINLLDKEFDLVRITESEPTFKRSKLATT